jgi:hypothetical protein
MDQYCYGKPEWTTEEDQEAMRRAMGQTLLLAERVYLAALMPREDLASSRYCLANPGQEYLIYLPDGGEGTVDLSAAQGTFTVEWLRPGDGTTTSGGTTEGGDQRAFQAPFDGDAVLYLWKEPR